MYGEIRNMSDDDDDHVNWMLRRYSSMCSTNLSNYYQNDETSSNEMEMNEWMI